MSEKTIANGLTFEELAFLNEQRAATYGFLARLYREELDQNLLEVMHEMTFPAHSGNKDLDAGNYEIACYLSNLWDNSVEELAIDYSRCFIGHGIDAHGAAYPYESVYTSEKRLMMQNARDEVLAIYRSEGVDKASDWKENEDHIALELEFMQIMCLRAAEKLRAGDEAAAREDMLTQKNFLEGHLLNWVPAFNADVRKFSKTRMYRGLASLADGELAADDETLCFLLDAEGVSWTQAAQA